MIDGIFDMSLSLLDIWESNVISNVRFRLYN